MALCQHSLGVEAWSVLRVGADLLILGVLAAPGWSLCALFAASAWGWTWRGDA